MKPVAAVQGQIARDFYKQCAIAAVGQRRFIISVSVV